MVYTWGPGQPGQAARARRLEPQDNQPRKELAWGPRPCGFGLMITVDPKMLGPKKGSREDQDKGTLGCLGSMTWWPGPMTNNC
jgi:hypothetical protein